MKDQLVNVRRYQVVEAVDYVGNKSLRLDRIVVILRCKLCVGCFGAAFVPGVVSHYLERMNKSGA